MCLCVCVIYIKFLLSTTEFTNPLPYCRMFRSFIKQLSFLWDKYLGLCLLLRVMEPKKYLSQVSYGLSVARDQCCSYFSEFLLTMQICSFYTYISPFREVILESQIHITTLRKVMRSHLILRMAPFISPTLTASSVGRLNS